MTRKNAESSDQSDLIKYVGKINNCQKTDPCDTVVHLNKLRLKNINR